MCLMARGVLMMMNQIIKSSHKVLNFPWYHSGIKAEFPEFIIRPSLEMWVYRSHLLVKKPWLGYIVQVIVIIHKAGKMAKYGRVNDRSKNLWTCAHIYVVLLTTVHSSCIVSKVDLDQRGIDQLVINQSISQRVSSLYSERSRTQGWHK